MYHPNAMLTVAHTREAELVREALHCGLAHSEVSGPEEPRRVLPLRLWLSALLTALETFFGSRSGQVETK